MTDEQISKPIEYIYRSGAKHSVPLTNALAHVFNHGTHHRGQVTDALSRLGYLTGNIDYLYSPVMDLKVIESD